jgi:signal transduction histidine kinase
MKVAVTALDGALRDLMVTWGWEVVDDPAAPAIDAVLTGDRKGIRYSAPTLLVTELPSPIPESVDDFVLIPMCPSEVQTRIEIARARRARVAKLRHDIRSALNSINGYAELIQEHASDEPLRFAGRIHEGVMRLIDRLQTMDANSV